MSPRKRFLNFWDYNNFKPHKQHIKGFPQKNLWKAFFCKTQVIVKVKPHHIYCFLIKFVEIYAKIC